MNALLLAVTLLGQCQNVSGQTVCKPVDTTTSATRAVVQTSLKTDKHGICVRIIAPEPDGKQSWGSGALIGGDSSRAYVLTNRHVVGDADEVMVWHRSGRFIGRVLRAGRKADLAIIMIRRPSYVYPLALAPDPPTGLIRSYGFPGVGNVLVRHEGRFSWSTPDLDAYDFGISSGESGGPVLNERGELVGVQFGSDPTHSRYAVAVSHARLREFLSVELCDERVITLSPFFLQFRRRWDRPRARLISERISDQPVFESPRQFGRTQDIAYNPPAYSEAVPPPPEVGPSGPVFQDAGLPPIAPKMAPPVSKVTPSPQQPTQLPADRERRTFGSPQQMPADVGGPTPMMALQPTAVDIPITVRATVGFSILRGALREALEAR